MSNDKDLWQLAKSDRLKETTTAKRRKVKAYQLIDKSTGKIRSEIQDFSLAFKTASAMEKVFRTKIVINPIYEEVK